MSTIVESMCSLISINDIGRTLSVQIEQDESPENLDFNVIINGDFCFYFNDAAAFFDWLDKLNDMAKRIKPQLAIK